MREQREQPAADFDARPEALSAATAFGTSAPDPVCTRCYPRYDFQRAYREFTRRLHDSEHAPPRLRRQLFQRILEQEASNGR